MELNHYHWVISVYVFSTAFEKSDLFVTRSENYTTAKLIMCILSMVRLYSIMDSNNSDDRII